MVLRKSALDSATSAMLNLTNGSLTPEELTIAIYNEAISGWGYTPSPQVDIDVNSWRKNLQSFS